MGLLMRIHCFTVGSIPQDTPILCISSPWGGGQNALNSYLMLPFMVFTGGKITPLVVRLPQAIVAIFISGGGLFSDERDGE